MAYGSIENNEVRTICENGKTEEKVKVEETENEEQSNETIEHLPNSEIRRPHRNQIIGSLFALISRGLFTTNNFLINQYSVSVPDLFLLRSIFILLIYFTVCYFRGYSPLPGNTRRRLMILLQGLTSSLTCLFCLAAVTFMPVPDALCIVFSAPVPTIILAAIFLKDRINFSKVLTCLLLVTGVILVCRPPFLFHSFSYKAIMEDVEYKNYSIGLILTLIATACGAIMNVVISECSSVPSPVLLSWSAVMGLLASLVYCLASPTSVLVTPASWAQVTPTMAALYIGLSISGLLAFTTTTRSLQLACPSLVSTLGCTELVVAFIVQSLITGQSPNILSCLGGVLIVTGVIILAFQEKIECLRTRLQRSVASCWRNQDPESQSLLR